MVVCGIVVAYAPRCASLSPNGLACEANIVPIPPFRTDPRYYSYLSDDFFSFCVLHHG